MASDPGNFLPDSTAWEIKPGRPKSVPGCQNTESRPHLQEGSSKCEENEQCFFFRCHKCLPDLMLGILLGANHEEELIFVPSIETITPQNQDLFNYDARNYEEKVECFGNYLQRLTEVKGVAINGWTDKDAVKIFDNLEFTFRQGVNSISYINIKKVFNLKIF